MSVTYLGGRMTDLSALLFTLNRCLFLEILHVVEFGVLSVEGNELVVSALFDDFAFVEHTD